MINVNRATNLVDFMGKTNDTDVQAEGVELIIDRFDHWCNSSDSASRSCWATYTRADEMAA